MTSLVLVEDHAIFREALLTLLAGAQDCEVVAEADNGPDAVALISQIQPDVLITDLSIPGMDGLEVIRRTVTTSERTAIVVLSGHGDEDRVVNVMRNGASAYVLKTDCVFDLEIAIRCVLKNRRFLSSSIEVKLDDIQALEDADLETDSNPDSPDVEAA